MISLTRILNDEMGYFKNDFDQLMNIIILLHNTLELYVTKSTCMNPLSFS